MTAWQKSQARENAEFYLLFNSTLAHLRATKHGLMNLPEGAIHGGPSESGESTNGADHVGSETPRSQTSGTA
jgi:hypothetical protein